MDSLTQEEQSVLDQFADITDYDREKDATRVLRLLTVCNWNLETAIARYFDNDFPQLFDEIASQHPQHPQERPPVSSFATINAQTSLPGDETAFRGATPVPVQPPALNLNNSFMLPYPEDLFIPKLHRAMPISNKWKFQAGLITPNRLDTSNSKLSKLLTPIVFLLMIMPRFLMLIGYGLNRLFGNFAPKLFRLLGLREEEGDFPSHPFYTTPEEIANYDIAKYINEVSKKEAPTSLLIYEGDFNKAYEHSRTNFKWFCIVLFNSKAESLSTKFVNEFLINDQFIDFITKNDVVLYVGDVAYPEAFEVSKTYSAFGLPYLALIANVSPTGMTHPEFSFVCKYNKFITSTGTKLNGDNFASKMCKRLTRIATKYEPQLITQRYDKQEADYARLIREEQDNAYQESLLKDIEREQAKQKKLDEEKLKLEKEREEELKVEIALAKRKEYIVRYINDNYDKDFTNLKKGEYTTIQFRTNDGQRFIRKFSNTETAFDIFMFITSKELMDVFIEEEEFENEKDVLKYLKDYDFRYDSDDKFEITFSFDLVSPMPRLRLKPEQKDLNQIKEIWPNGSLLIERIEDEDDDDSDDSE